MTAWIAHVDLDAFFAACEQRDNPEFRGKPVIVGARPGGRGVVAACSYEARVFGVHSAMPISQAAKRCPDAIYVRPDMAKYARESKTIMQLLESITPVVEKASIDEAYLDLSGLEKTLGSPAAIGQLIRSTIFEHTGLTASVGIGPNRLIAKLGSEACKPDGLKIVAEDEVLEFLAPMPVGNLRGLGKVTLQKISKIGIKTVADLRGVAPETLAAHVGRKSAASFLRQAQGIASERVDADRGRKSISKEMTFGQDVSDPQKLHDTLLKLAAQVAHTARTQSLAGKVVTLKIRFAGFDTYTRQRTLTQATCDERVVLRTVLSLLDKGDLPQRPVRLIGVGLSQWQAAGIGQDDLFAESGERPQDEKILAAIEKANDKFGKPLLQIGLPRKHS